MAAPTPSLCPRTDAPCGPSEEGTTVRTPPSPKQDIPNVMIYCYFNLKVYIFKLKNYVRSTFSFVIFLLLYIYNFTKI